MTLRLLQSRQAVPDEVGDRRRFGERTVPHPDAAAFDQHAAREPDPHELSEEQEVAARHVREMPARAAVDRRAEHRREDLTNARAVERREVDPCCEVVLPQRRDRVGHGFPGSHRGDDAHRAVQRQLV